MTFPLDWKKSALGDRGKFMRAFGLSRNAGGHLYRDKTQRGILSRTGDLSRDFLKRKASGAGKVLRNTPKTLGRWTRKAVVGGIPGAALGLAGLAVGAASGDPSKALQLAGAGAAAGFYGANYYGDKFAAHAIKEAREDEATFWGTDMSAIERDRFDKKYLRDPNVISQLTKYTGNRSTAINAIKDGTIQEMLQEGITDPSKQGKVIKTMKNIQSKHSGMSKDEALAKAIGIVNYSGITSSRIFDPGSTENKVFNARMMKQFQDAGLTESQAKTELKDLIEYLGDIMD